MFSFQRNFGLPTEVITREQFRALITAPETFRKVKEAREALARGDKSAYETFRFFHNEVLLKKFGLVEVPRDEINLTPGLFIKQA